MTLLGGPPSRRSLCLFCAKPNKDLSSRSSTRLEVGKGTPEKAVGKRNPEKAVGEGWSRGTVDNGQQKWPVGWDRVQWAVRKTDKMSSQSGVDNGQQKDAVSEGQSGWVGISNSFVEISLEIHARVSLQMHREYSVTGFPFLHFELT